MQPNSAQQKFQSNCLGPLLVSPRFLGNFLRLQRRQCRRGWYKRTSNISSNKKVLPSVRLELVASGLSVQHSTPQPLRQIVVGRSLN